MGKTTGLLLLVAAFAGATAAAVDSKADLVTLTFNRWSEDEKTITRKNLIRIQRFIIEQGHRETYSNVYDSNPAYRTARFRFYLDPDTGLANVDSELGGSGFHRLTIHWPANGRDQYRNIDFLKEHEVLVRASDPTKDMTVEQVRQFAADAIIEILAKIDDETAPGSASPEASAGLGAGFGDGTSAPYPEFPESTDTVEELRVWAASNDGTVVAQEEGLVGVVAYDFDGIGYGRVGIYRVMPTGLELITATKKLLLPEVSAVLGRFSIKYRVEEAIDPSSIPRRRE